MVRQSAGEPWLLATMAAFASLLVFTRRPDAVLAAQFWAEDGKHWYADAYNLGPLVALFLPHDGYFQTISRLVAAASLLVPLQAAPYVFNLAALALQVLPAVFFVSSRSAALVPSLAIRMAIAVLYLALPAPRELHANITNAHSHLALFALLVVLAPPPGNWRGRVFEGGLLVLSGVSGLYAALLFPIAMIASRVRRSRWHAILAAIAAAAAALQLASLALAPDTRVHGPLGASWELLLRILGGQVALSGLLGVGGYRWALEQASWAVYPAALVAVSILACCALQGPTALRLFVAFASLALAGGLSDPQVSASAGTRWEALTRPDVGGRYFFFPTLALVAGLVWMAALARPRLVRWAADLLLGLVIMVGAPLDWEHPPFEDLEFTEHAARFEQTPAGRMVEFPLNPRDWHMVLAKRELRR